MFDSKIKPPSILMNVNSAKSVCYVYYRLENFYKIKTNSNKSNVFSFLKSVSVTNSSDTDLYNSKICFSFSNSYIRCDAINLGCLEKHKTTIVNSFNIVIDSAYLYGLSEAAKATLKVELFDSKGKSLCTHFADFSFMPIEQAMSIDITNESLASFSTPDDEATKGLTNKASNFMRNKYGASYFVGYLTHDPEIVMRELDSLYLVLQSEGIHCINPPEPFELTFQRVRMPRSVISEKTGTCLDFALLYASMCEAVGLNPLIVVMNGHIFNGVWLGDYHYPNAVSDNLTVLTNDCSSTDRRMVLVDPSCAASGNDINFASSLNQAQSEIVSMPFSWVLDIKTARLDYILPLPTPRNIDGKTVIDYDNAISTDYQVPRVEQPAGSLSLESKGSKSKFDVWEENLLDLEMSNNLINHKIGSSSVQLGASSVFDFYSKAIGSEKLSVIPDSERTPADTKRFLSYQFSIEDKKKFDSALSSNRLYAFSKKGKTEDVLISLARKSTTQVEESGCNPLFLTMGMIEWYDSNLSKQTITAPIILVPATMPKRRTGPYFSLDLDFDSMQLNAAVFEYFKRVFDLDFSELEGFFDKSRGVDDIKKLFNTIRQKIAPKGNWVVDDSTITLSLFSFAHFVMWSDMKTHRDIFIKNKVVSSMVHGAAEYEKVPESLSESSLDENVAPGDLAVPLSADSSQLLAIKASDLGLSFVLDGPPGTGKSQTIANIIVNAMYKGKKVLFVAEKEVALDVVKSRLDSLSLGRFCLQIHSAKANKKDVLAQLGESLSTGPTREVNGYQEEAESLKRQRGNLNKTLEELHGKGKYFVSPYVALIRYLENESAKDNCLVDDEYASTMGSDKYQKCISAIEDMIVASHGVNGYYGNPFIYFDNKEYSLDLREKYSTALPPLIEALGSFADAYTKYSKKSGFTLKTSKNNIDLLIKAFDLIRQKSGKFFPELVASGTILSQAESTINYFESLAVYASLRDQINKTFDLKVTQIDAENLQSRFKMSESYGFFAKRKTIKSILKELKPYTISKFRKRDLMHHLEQIGLLKGMKSSLEQKTGYWQVVFPNEIDKDFQAINADYEKVKNTIELLKLVRGLEVGSDDEYKKAYKKVSALVKSPDALYADDINNLTTTYQNLIEQNEKLKPLGFDCFRADDNDVYFGFALGQIASAHKGIERLGEWCRFLSCLDDASKLLPPSLIESYKNGKLSISKLRSSFDCALFYKIVCLSLTDLGLANLSSLQTEQQIAKYKKTLSDFQRLTVEETARRITASFPRTDVEYAESSLAYQLRKLVKTNGRGKTLRAIIDQYADDIFKLCPCFLMSPLSAAQYLDPEKHHFDIVIFDEASQIPTSEAIGAIARGDSCIIAGDQQQMPPTNFFTSSLSYSDQPSDDVVVYQDLESLLDDAIALNLPRYRLSWHYRSHHESLIAFSNNRFYDNTLCTFPTPSNQQSQVRMVQVKGNYEKGRGVNREEAKAIVNEIVRRVKDEKLSKLSIGVVTFNKKQQDLITDMLDAKFDANPSLIRTPGGEEIFVKNLENVQGDERDVILFSICFGPDKKTKTMNLNFGPLSREKGERRLNVAVSRAKEEMVVFCSCQPEDIRASSAKNSGAEYLKAFLMYAKSGVKTLANQSSWNIPKEQLSIAPFLASDLIKDGYLVDINVGSSAFKVDIAVKDPLDPNKYALGIVCDGPSYSESTFTCDDRNVIAPGMLDNLKWRLMRVWSVEYLDHPNLVVKKIEKELSEPHSAMEVKKEAAKPISLVKATPDNPYPHKVEYPELNYPRLDNIIRDLPGVISRILADESPISMTLLKKRIRDIFSLKRVDSKMLYRITHQLDLISAFKDPFDGEDYYWPSSQDPEGYKSYRVGGDRELSDISKQEIVNAKEDIESIQGQLSDDDLCHKILELFGFSVLSERSKSHILRSFREDLSKPEI